MGLGDDPRRRPRHVDPDSRTDFFAELLIAGQAAGELTMTVNGKTFARGGTRPHKGGR